MKKLIFAALLASMGTMGQAAILMQQDATSAQAGTLPAGLSASFDGTVDVQVIANSSINPVPPVDHAGGDGFSLRVGDLGSGGGSFNWVYATTPDVATNVSISAWYYVDFTNGFDVTTQERDYLLIARLNAANPHATTPVQRAGYYFVVSRAASWTGAPTIVDRKPYLLKRNADTTYTQIGSFGSADVTDGWHQLKLTVDGSDIKGYVDNVLVVSGSDSTYTGTGVAWGYYDDNGAAAVPTVFPYAAAIDNILYESIVPSGSNQWTVYQ